jgi:uncharacterized membrane protein
MPSFPIPAPAFDGNSRSVPAGNAFDWLKQGWTLFVANPGMWIVLTILLIVLVFALMIVPLIGALAANLLTPVVAAGLMRICQRIDQDETLDIADVLSGFRHNTNNLIMLGVALLVGLMLSFVVVMALGGGSVVSALLAGSPLGIGLAVGGLLLAMLLSTVLMVPLSMALWFAPALVFFNNMSPMDALKASFNACLKNVPAFLVYGLIVVTLLFFAALPAGLGLLVLMPVIAGSTYASYRDIFVAN